MDIKQEFINPPKDYSMQAFWFWNGELAEDKLRWQLDEMVDKGIYGGFMHPRAYLKTPYLEQEWWDAVRACVDEGKKKGFSTWLYDEYAWPSGTAGSTFEYGFQKPSRTLAEGEKNMAKGLYARTFDMQEENLAQKGDSPDDLLVRQFERDGKIMAFYKKVFPKAVDYLNRDTIARFITYTHEEYRKRFGDDFGSVIPGIFFDEIYMMGNPIPWTDQLPEVFKKTCGYDLMEVLPSLVEGECDQDQKVRQDYYGVVTDMYEDAFFVQISEWCEKNKLKLTGHTEEFLWEHPRRQGDYFKTMRHLAIPGSDNHDYRYRFPRKITYCEPKYSVSVARAYEKSRCMSEAMGGAGWGCSLEEFKRGINTLGAMGTNLFIPHGFYYECDHQGSQSDWPSSFFYQNPYWKYFKSFADYVRRICYMNSIGTAVVEYGIYYPAGEMQANMVNGEENRKGTAISESFHAALDNMIEHQMDTDMIDEESLLRAEMSGGVCAVGSQRFATLLFPEGMEFTDSLFSQIKRFADSGGRLVFYKTGYGGLPQGLESCLCCDAQELPAKLKECGSLDAEVIFGDKKDLFINHRSFEGGEFYFVSNSSNRERDVILRLRCVGDSVYFLNPEDGRAQTADSISCEAGTDIKLHLYPDEAGYLLFNREDTALSEIKKPERDNKELEEPVMGAWEFLPLSKEYDNKWGTDAKMTQLEIPVALFASELSEEAKLIRICNSKNQDGRSDRHTSLWNANWITRRPSWNDQLSASDLYFRKVLKISGEVLNAEFCAVAVQTLEVYVNGRLAFTGDSHGEPLTFSLKGALCRGGNLIAVHVHNDHPLNDVYVCSAEELPTDRFISLLMQGEIDLGTEKLQITTDAEWIVNDCLEKGWNELDCKKEEQSQYADVLKCKNFNQGLPSGLWLNAWERGTPPLKPWGDLPLFGKLKEYPLTLYYTFTAPAGACRIYEPVVSGEFSSTLDGKPVVWKDGKLDLKAQQRPRRLEISVTAHGGEDGVKKPLRADILPVRSPLKDWRWHGLDWFSGRCMYTNVLELNQVDGQYELDLGKVCHYAEVWVNGQLAGTRIWAPYRLPVTGLLKAGHNTITVITANSAANERRNLLVDEGMALGWNRYWNEDNIDREPGNSEAGLLGPVTLYKKTGCLE